MQALHSIGGPVYIKEWAFLFASYLITLAFGNINKHERNKREDSLIGHFLTL